MANQIFYIAGGQGAANDTHVYRSYNGLSPASVVAVPITHYGPTNARKIYCMKDGDPGFIMAVGDNDLCYLSRNGGQTWVQSAGMVGSGDLLTIGSNYAGSGLETMVGGRDGQTWFSVNGGVTMQQHNVGSLPTPGGSPIPGAFVTHVYEQAGIAWYALVYDPALNETHLFGAAPGSGPLGAMTTTPGWGIYGTFPGVRFDWCVQLGPTTMLFTGPTGAETSYNLGIGSTTVSGPSPAATGTNIKFTSKITSPGGDFGWMAGDNNELFDLNSYTAPFPIYALLTPAIPGQVRSTNVLGIGTFALGSTDGGGPGPYEWFNSFDNGATANAVILSAPLEINGGDMMEGCVYEIGACEAGDPFYVVMPCGWGPGQVVEIAGSPILDDGCYIILSVPEEVEEIIGIIGQDEIVDIYDTCESCSPACQNYFLEPCEGNPNDPQIIDCNIQDLSVYVGNIIKFDGYCWLVAETEEEPTLFESIVFTGPYRSCEACESAPINYLIQNCVTGIEETASGTGYVLGQIISLVTTPTLENCWEVTGTTEAPPTIFSDVLDTFSDCDSCNEGIQSYIVQNCDTGELRIVTLIAAANPGDVLVLQGMIGYEGDSCWIVEEETIEPGEDFPTLIGVVEDCETCGAPPPTCYTLVACDPASPDIPEAVSGGPGADLAGNLGQVVTINGIGGVCYTVLENFSCVAPVTIVSVAPVGVDCGGFTITTPVVIPTTIVGGCTTFTIPVQNNSADTHDFKLILNCLGTGITLISPPIQTIGPGGTFLYEAQFCPTSDLHGTCDYTVSGPCGKSTGEICYKSVTVTECSYFNICITNDNTCAPDCIEVGTAVPIDIGGHLDAGLYPIDITIKIIHQDTGTEVYNETTTVNDDAELDALQPTFIPTVARKYCIEVCLPGCDSTKTWCFDVCDPTGVYKDDCKKYHLFRPHGCGPQKYNVTVKCFESNDIVFGPEVWDVALDNFFHFTVPHDGIYIIEVADFITGSIIYTYAIFETCELEKCFKILMDKIMCSCADPCCKKCNGTPQKEVEFARMTLNKLNPLYLTYLGLAAKYKTDTLGIHIISEYTTDYLHEAHKIMEKIHELLEKCDCLCHEQKNTKTNRGGCSTC